MNTYIINEDQLRASVIALQMAVDDYEVAHKNYPNDSVILEDLEYYRENLKALRDMLESA